jgi:hypothetical protein
MEIKNIPPKKQNKIERIKRTEKENRVEDGHTQRRAL